MLSYFDIAFQSPSHYLKTPPPSVSLSLRITVQLLTKQIQAFRENLTRERKERFELQEKRDGLSRELEDFRQEFAKYMSTMSERINKAKQDHVDLTNEASLDMHFGWGCFIIQGL